VPLREAARDRRIPRRLARGSELHPRVLPVPSGGRDDIGTLGQVATFELWALYAQPPGERDLARHELWQRSQERSLRRRELAAARRPGPSRGTVSAALVAATLIVPAAERADAQSAAAALVDGNLRFGSRGPAVAAAQRALGISADGIFGPQTRAAVIAFQRAHGLVADGIIGPITRGALGGGSGSAGGTTTMALQRALGVAADGEYGPITRAAVRRFQAQHGLLVDGIAGLQTLGALGLPTNVTLGDEPGPSTTSSGAWSAVAAARSIIGAGYAYGGNGPSRFDCSGLTVYAMRAAGVSLPRTSYSQFNVGTPVDRASIQAGDLVFFDTDGSGASHVGVATSNSSVISATASSGVVEHSISGPYWGSRYVGARRVA
jgi:peptidoglycan DL-endopeptidase CwlO